MKNELSKLTSNLLNDEEGVTAAEYGLILGLIALIIITAVTGLGTAVQSLFVKASSSI